MAGGPATGETGERRHGFQTVPNVSATAPIGTVGR
jgi:hypothetical protein